MLSTEQLQIIEKYFTGQKLSSEEQNSFNSWQENDSEFIKELNFRSSLKNTLFRKNVRETGKKEFSRLKRIKLLKFGLITAFGIAVLGATFYVLSNYKKEAFAQSEIEEVVDFEKINLNAVTGESFVYNSDQSTVFESKNRTVVVIPKNAFETKNGETPESATVTLQEYLNPEDIIKAGLSTVSNEDELETGGMFNLTAKDPKGKELKLKEGKEILFEVPTKEKKTGMQVFESELDSNGNINWVNPKALDNFLTTVEINTLDFYPPGYLEKLNTLGYGNKNRAFKDSLFYSFYCDQEINFITESYFAGKNLFEGNCRTCHSFDSDQTGPLLKDVTKRRNKEWLVNFIDNPSKMIYEGDTASLRMKEQFGSVMPSLGLSKHEINYIIEFMAHQEFETTYNDSTTNSTCGIEPSQIKAIWNKKYQNTYIATKEFEERLKVIYSTCDKKVLDIYLNNLSKPLSYTDNKAYQLTKDKKFQKFFWQNAGSVKISDELSQILNKYYQEKSKVFSKLAQESYSSYQKEQNKLDQIASEKGIKNSKENTKRNYENYWSEFEHNLEKANKDLGTNYKFKKGVGVVTPPITEKYQFRVSQLGACNIDRFMKDILETRNTASYTENGKTTKFSFKNVKIVLPLDTFSLVRVYFTSPTLYSFIKSKKDSLHYAYSINESMNYNLIVYLEKGNQKYFYGLKDIKESISMKKEDLILTEDFDKAIEPFIAKMKIQDISKDIEYEKFKLKDDSRKAKRVKMEKLRNELEGFIFPCQHNFNLDVSTSSKYHIK